MTKVTGVCAGIIDALLTNSPPMLTFVLIPSISAVDPPAWHLKRTGYPNL